ncbi:MAG TPA: hypothetical protein VGJ20_41840 [Xanthobacteraceae bacterium]|jgi:hypothetical protein
MRALSLVIGLIGVVILPYGCNAQAVYDPFSDYLQRSVTISLGAGNAKDANAAIQTIDPWPPYVGDTRIPGDGRRAADAVERMYRVPDPFERETTGAASGPAAPGGAPGGEVGVSISGAAPATPMQPVSGGY